MPRVVHFEIGVQNPERAGEFYKQVFGWEIHKWDGPEPYWLVGTGKEGTGINGAIMFSTTGQPETILSVIVPSVTGSPAWATTPTARTMRTTGSPSSRTTRRSPSQDPSVA